MDKSKHQQSVTSPRPKKQRFFTPALLANYAVWFALLLVVGVLAFAYWPLPVALVAVLAFLPQIPLLGNTVAQRLVIMDLELQRERKMLDHEAQQVRNLSNQMQQLSQHNAELTEAINHVGMLLRTQSQKEDGDAS